MNLNGKAMLITGASRGLGRALSQAAAKRGARVVLTARDPAVLEATVEDIVRAGGSAYAVPADIGDKDAIYPLAGTAEALAGPIDVLVHNASTLGPVPLRLLLDTECEDLSRVLEVNLVGPFRLTKILAGSMAMRRTGVVLHLSSDAAVEAYPTWGAYSASKAAQDHLSRVLAAELAPFGVRVLSVDPGEMNTQMHAEAVPDADPATLRDPQDVAEALIRMIEGVERIESGARVVAGEWAS